MGEAHRNSCSGFAVHFLSICLSVSFSLIQCVYMTLKTTELLR